jgi:MFS family permease
MSNPVLGTQGTLGLFQPFRVSRNFTALWAGQSLATFGGAIFNVVLPMMTLSLQQSTVTLGLVMALTMAPQVVLLPFAGILADRLPRVPLMIGTDLVRFGLLTAMALLMQFHWMNTGVLYAFAVLFGAMQGLFQPAYAAVRAEIFTPDIRYAANAITQGTQQLAMLVGPSVGGFIVGMGSIVAGLWANAAGYLTSVLSLLFVRSAGRMAARPHDGHHNVGHKGALRGFWRELLAGVEELRKHPWLWVTIVVFSAVNIALTGILLVLLPWLIRVHLHMSPSDYGLISSASGVGALVMSVIFGQKKAWRRRGLLAYTAVGLAGLALGALAFAHSVPVIALLMAIQGAAIMCFGLIWEVSLQELVSPEAYGRVASLDMFGSYSLLPVGYFVTGWLAEVVGGVATLEIWACSILLLVGVTLLVPSIRKFE